MTKPKPKPLDNELIKLVRSLGFTVKEATEAVEASKAKPVSQKPDYSPPTGAPRRRSGRPRKP